MAGPGGGVFGERALNDKKTGGPRTIQAPDGVYTFEEIKHYSAKNFPYFDDKAIIAEYKTGDKQNTIQGRGKGAYVATLGKNGKAKRYIIGYNMEKKTLDAISTVTPGKLKPSLSWKSATGGETLKLQAVTLVKKGKVVTKDWLFGEENVRCYSFTKADKLIESVMEGLKGNPNVTKTIIDCMEEYFAGDLKSIGCDDVPRGHMREIAKYVGEIIPAIAAMKGVDLYVSTPPWNRDKKTDLMVMPTLDESINRSIEGFGIAYIEAAFFGIPSIASDFGGANEAVLHNKTGIIIKDMNKLYESINELLSNNEKRKELGRQAQKRANEDFNWDSVANKYLKTFKS